MMSTCLFLLTILVPILSQDAKPSSSNNCFAHFDKYGSRFDVCNLQLVTGENLQHYKIEDSKNTPNSTDKYKYIFNVGGSVADIDTISQCSPTLKNHSYCNYTTDNTKCIDNTQDKDKYIIPITDNVWAYQVKFTGNSTNYNDIDCYFLSNFNGGPPQWRLINDLNPVEGVILTYLNGDFASGCGKNREFSIKFQCEDTGERFMPSNQGPINEYSLCSYTWTIQSLHGCPTQCPRAHDKICSGNGLCSYDNTLNASRCYCFGQMTGNECLTHNDNIKIYQLEKTPPTPSDFVYIFDNKMNNKSYKVTYDLSKWNLTATNAYFEVSDKFNQIDNNISVNDTTNTRDNFIYYMGIAQIIEIPNECSNHDNLTNKYNKVYAVQMNLNTKYCFVLGIEKHWELVDTIDDPARGVTLKYTNGSDEGCFGSNREFSVSMVCPDFVMNNNNKQIFDAKVETQIARFVEEPEVCSYKIEIETATACPYQCINDNTATQFEICSQHGMCVSDPIINQVRCVCDSKWHGPLCDIPPTQSPTINPTQSPTNKPTSHPTNKPTVKPTGNPTIKPTGSPIIAQVIVKEKTDNHSAFIVSILGLCLVVIIAIFIGRFCYKKMKSTHEEFKEYTQFRDNTQKKKKGSIGFSMRGNAGKVNVPDNSDDEETNEDQLL